MSEGYTDFWFRCYRIRSCVRLLHYTTNPLLFLPEVEKDLAKLAEQGKLSRSPIRSPISLPINPHSANAMPVPGFSSKPNSPSKTPMLPLLIGRTQSPSNPCSRAQTPSRPLTPNSLMMRSLPTTSHGNPDRIYRRSRSRPVTPTGQITRPLLTPPGLSSTDSFSLRSTLSEVSHVPRSHIFSVTKAKLKYKHKQTGSSLTSKG